MYLINIEWQDELKQQKNECARNHILPQQPYILLFIQYLLYHDTISLLYNYRFVILLYLIDISSPKLHLLSHIHKFLGQNAVTSDEWIDMISQTGILISLAIAPYIYAYYLCTVKKETGNSQEQHPLTHHKKTLLI